MLGHILMDLAHNIATDTCDWNWLMMAVWLLHWRRMRRSGRLMGIIVVNVGVDA